MLTSLAHSAFSTWLLQSDSIWAYPIVLTLHTFAMMALAGAALVIDLRLLGFADEIPLPTVVPLFRALWGAFAISAVTGTILFIATADTRGRQLLFWIKLALVALGLVTAVMIRRRSVRGDVEAVAKSDAVKRLAIVSVFAWLAAITAGRFLAYIP